MLLCFFFKKKRAFGRCKRLRSVCQIKKMNDYLFFKDLHNFALTAQAWQKPLPKNRKMKSQTPITMKDIAKDLGVSIATVSRALKDSPRISAAQRERIQQYAREHNFYPNVIGEALRHSRVMSMKIIGVIVPEFIHYYFASILTGIEEEARARGYRIMVALSDEKYEREVRICDDFYRNKVCGIIVSQAKDTTQYEHFRDLSKTACRSSSTTASAPASTARAWSSMITWEPSRP